jgi:hypothetical protein
MWDVVVYRSTLLGSARIGLGSESCRFYKADVAVDAGDAMAPCPLLPAGRISASTTVHDRNRRSVGFKLAQAGHVPDTSAW